ncbi:MAG: DUF434 domain-containing protein [Bacteroidales bacterium]|nr:DUF434 domain-containing protein [Bacteroidales bacterium]
MKLTKQQMFSDVLKEAVSDYYLLLNHGYPQKSILKMVGDRFRLTGSQRSLLYRGVCKKSEAELRLKKIITEPPSGSKLFIDGYNVLLTMANYLAGRPVFISIDGLLRDSGEIHGKIRKSKMFNQAVDNLIETMKYLDLQEVNIYLDEPVSHSAELAVALNIMFSDNDMPGKAEVVRYPDHHLKNVSKGILATSDSVIIDKTTCTVFDLARFTLERLYNPEFVFINEFLK